MSVLCYSVIAVALFVGYQYVAIISKKAHRTHQEGAKSHHRREIADGCYDFTFAKVKNNMKNTFVKVKIYVSLHFEKVNCYDARRLSTT